MPTDAEQFALDCEAVKNALVAILIPLAPKAKIIKRWAWDGNADQWGGILRSPTDIGTDGKKRVHAICVYFDGIGKEPQAPITSAEFLLPLGLSFFQQYELGTDDDNTESRMQEEISIIAYTLEQYHDLNVRPIVMRHLGLSVPNYVFRRDIAPPCLLGESRLMVRMQTRYIQQL